MRKFRESIGALSLALALVLVALPARAHMGSTKTIDAELTAGGAQLVVQVDTVDAALALGLGLDADFVALAARRPLLEKWLVSGIALRTGTAPCNVDASALEPGQRDGRATARLVLRYRCADEREPIVLRDDTIFDDDAGHRTIVTVRDEQAAVTRFLTASDRELLLQAAPPVTATSRHFFVEGVVHLFTGYDHLAFLLSLLLAAGVVASELGRRRALRDAALVVTAFTLGHSVTLALAALDVVALPTRLVESAIAASVVVVAVLNVLRPASTVGRPGLAAAFGLIHGFGFSSVLGELGLPAGQRALALASFNIGIELAQLAFVAAVLPLLAFAGKTKSYRALIVQGGSAAIAGLGAIWLIERVLG